MDAPSRHDEPVPPAIRRSRVLAVVAFPHEGGALDHARWRQEHLDAEHALKVSRPLQSDLGPQHRAAPHPDVRYSLDRA